MTDTLKDIEMIRLRPGMYIGDVHDGSGLHHMIWEVVANSLDQHLGGTCQSISVTIGEDSSVTVEDDGHGIPIHGRDGAPFAERALTSLHDTPTFDGHAPHEHLDSHGVGLCVVNALSSWLVLEVFRQGRHYRQRYEQGHPCSPPEVVGSTSRTGTRITFLHDSGIFSDPWINAGTVAAHLRGLACLASKLTLSFADHRRHLFHESLGIQALVERTRSPGERILGALSVNEIVNDITVEARMEWRDHVWSSVDSYANVESTKSGGTHVQGLLKGLALGLRDCELTRAAAAGDRGPTQRAPKKSLLDVFRRVVSHGLHAVVRVRLNDLRFDMPTRSRLVTPAVETAVAGTVRPLFTRELEQNPLLRARMVQLLHPAPP